MQIIVPMLFRPTVLSRAIARWRAGHYDGTLDALVDESGNGLHARFGSTVGADSNDPLRLPYSGEKYIYLPGSSGNNASCPAIAAIDGATQLDIRVRFVADDWTTLSKDFFGCYNSAANKRAFVFSSNPTTSKRLTLTISGNGTSGNAIDAGVAWPLTTGVPIWVRATWRASDQRTQFFTSSDYNLNTQTGTWTQVGSNVTMPGAVASLFTATQPLILGGKVDQATNWAGSYYQAELRLTIDGAVAASFDGSTFTAATTTYTDPQANVWTLNRGTLGRKLSVVDLDLALLGTDDYFEVADNALLNFGSTDSFTAAVVFRRYTTPGNFCRLLSKKGASGAGAGYTIENLNTGTAVYGTVGDGTNQPGAGAQVNQNVTYGALTAFGIQVDRAGSSLRSFKNSVVSSTALGTLGSMSNSNPLRIGSESYTAGSYADMEFVAGAIWREALPTSAWVRFLNEVGIQS